MSLPIRGPRHKRGDLRGSVALPRSPGPPGANSRARGGFDWLQEGTQMPPKQTLLPIKFAFSNCLCAFLEEWSRITSDRWVVNTISQGYTLQFVSSPPSHPPLWYRPITCTPATAGSELAPQLGSCGGSSKGVLGTGVLLLLLSYPEGKRGSQAYPGFARPQSVHGQMPVPHGLPGTYHTLAGDWYVDLQDAYFHIHIFEGHKRFLRFLVGQDHYQFTVLPFGLSTAPRVFTKCMAVVAAYLKRQGVQIFPYLDDWLLKGSLRSQVQDHLELLLATCANLGLLVNEAKSTLVLVQHIEFIGTLLDASKATASLPPGRFQ
ncbi:ORF 3, partial [Chelydra serpentina]